MELELEIREIERSITLFSHVSETNLPTKQPNLSNRLVKLLGCISNINCSLQPDDDSASETRTPFIMRCQGFGDLVSCFPKILLKVISNVPLLNDDDAKHWYSHILKLTFQCFQTMKSREYFKVEVEYFHSLLGQTLECLSHIFHEQMKSNVTVLILLDITHACLVELPITTVNVLDATSTLSRYFQHQDVDIQISAYNSAQFLIPVTEKSNLDTFILNPSKIHNILGTCGKSISVVSTLNLILSYGKIPDNCCMFLEEGILLYAVVILLQSSDFVEKELAYSVVKVLTLSSN